MFFIKWLTASLTAGVKYYFRHHCLKSCVITGALLLLNSIQANALYYEYNHLCSIPNIAFTHSHIFFSPDATPTFSPVFHSQEFPGTFEMHVTLNTGQTLRFHSNNNISCSGITMLQLAGITSTYAWYLHVASMPPMISQYSHTLVAPFPQQPPFSEQAPDMAIDHLNQPTTASPITLLSTTVETLEARVDELTIKLDHQQMELTKKPKSTPEKNNANYQELKKELSQKKSIIDDLSEK